MNDGPIYQGYTQERKQLHLHLPITMPGYGLVEDEAGWMTFVQWLRFEMDAHQATRRALELSTALDDTDNDYNTRLQEYAVRNLP